MRYPMTLYASALLLDWKIENWKVSGNQKSHPFDFKHNWKKDRLNDYTVESHSWIVNNDEEHKQVFDELAQQWLSQWKHADDYKLIPAYGV